MAQEGVQVWQLYFYTGKLIKGAPPPPTHFLGVVARD